MINSISNFGYNVNRHIFFKTVFKYSTAVEENSRMNFGYNIEEFIEKNVNMNFSIGGAITIQNSILNSFYSIGDTVTTDYTVIRKNDGD